MPYAVRVAAVVLALCGSVFAQAGAPIEGKPVSVPESGLVAPGKYVNAFFGFALPIPQSDGIRPFTPQVKGTKHFLFGLQANLQGLTILGVTAKQEANLSDGTVSEEAGSHARPLTIGGMRFWESESKSKSSAGTQLVVQYTTGISGYVLMFFVTSFDSKLTKQLQQGIESISFFDPAKAAEIAGSGATLSPAAAALQPVASDLTQFDAGSVSGGVYRNPTLGFAYEFPRGWAVTDQKTQEKVVELGHQRAWGNDPEAAREHEEVNKCMRRLLWVTEQPEGTQNGKFNPLVVVIAVAPGCLQGFQFPTSLSDKDTMKSAAKQILDAFKGAPFLGTENASMRAFTTQGHLILDISGRSKINIPDSKEPQPLFTSLDFTQLNGYLVAWGFMSDTQSGLEEIKSTKIQFTPLPSR